MPEADLNFMYIIFTSGNNRQVHPAGNAFMAQKWPFVYQQCIYFSQIHRINLSLYSQYFELNYTNERGAFCWGDDI